jgi:hypothetical protein
MDITTPIIVWERHCKLLGRRGSKCTFPKYYNPKRNGEKNRTNHLNYMDICMSKYIISHLFNPVGTFDIESLSILLNVRFLNCSNSNVFPVQLTGTKTIRVSMVMGINIFKLQKKKKKMYSN